MDGERSQPPPPPDSRQGPSVSSTVQMALYRPRGQPPDRQEEEQQLRSEDAPPPDDHDRLAEGALGGSDSTVSTAPRPRLDSAPLVLTSIRFDSVSQNLPGTDAYWRSAFNEFEASTMQQSHHFGRIPALFHTGSMAEYHEYDLRCILATYVSLSYAGPRNVHSFGDIYELPSVQNDVEDVLPPNNRLAEGAPGGSDSTVSTATHPRRRRHTRTTSHTTSVSLPQQSLRVGDRITLLPNFYVENSRANGAVYQLSGMESFGDIDQIPRVQGTRFGPGPSHGPTR